MNANATENMKGTKMSVTDNIVEEIVAFCRRHGLKQYSRDVIEEDHLCGNMDTLAVEFADEIIIKLKTKGITVVP